MNIKSILLGSAAALAVVSGAHAADAIVAAAPEPAEYVKVCDAFGAGYFYIPGSETCLKVGGLVRFDVSGGKYLGKSSSTGETWSTYSRFQLNVSTASDTEYGPLKTSAKIRFNDDNGTSKFGVNEATISLGGLTLGHTDSLFTTITGYAGSVINDGDKVGYGPFDSQLIQYTYKAGPLSVAGSLEFDGTAGQDYVPYLVGGVAYSGEAGGFSAAVGYDESKSAGAIKARVDGSFGALSAFLMAGYNTGNVPNHFAVWNGDWAIWGGASAKVSDMVSLNAQVGYDSSKSLEVSANTVFTLASGFAITPEVAYSKSGATGDGTWGGMVRFNRSF